MNYTGARGGWLISNGGCLLYIKESVKGVASHPIHPQLHILGSFLVLCSFYSYHSSIHIYAKQKPVATIVQNPRRNLPTALSSIACPAFAKVVYYKDHVHDIDCMRHGAGTPGDYSGMLNIISSNVTRFAQRTKSR